MDYAQNRSVLDFLAAESFNVLERAFEHEAGNPAQWMARSMYTDLGGRVMRTDHTADLDFERIADDCSGLPWLILELQFGLGVAEGMISGIPGEAATMQDINRALRYKGQRDRPVETPKGVIRLYNGLTFFDLGKRLGANSDKTNVVDIFEDRFSRTYRPPLTVL